MISDMYNSSTDNNVLLLHTTAIEDVYKAYSWEFGNKVSYHHDEKSLPAWFWKMLVTENVAYNYNNVFSSGHMFMHKNSMMIDSNCYSHLPMDGNIEANLTDINRYNVVR